MILNLDLLFFNRTVVIYINNIMNNVNYKYYFQIFRKCYSRSLNVIIDNN